jgi:hypothetical protein
MNFLGLIREMESMGYAAAKNERKAGDFSQKPEQFMKQSQAARQKCTFR